MLCFYRSLIILYFVFYLYFVFLYCCLLRILNLMMSDDYDKNTTSHAHYTALLYDRVIDQTGCWGGLVHVNVMYVCKTAIAGLFSL